MLNPFSHLNPHPTYMSTSNCISTLSHELTTSIRKKLKSNQELIHK